MAAFLIISPHMGQGTRSTSTGPSSPASIFSFCRSNSSSSAAGFFFLGLAAGAGIGTAAPQSGHLAFLPAAESAALSRLPHSGHSQEIDMEVSQKVSPLRKLALRRETPSLAYGGTPFN